MDLVVQTAFGFKRVQVKTTAAETDSIRVRRLGATNTTDPCDRYDVLAVVNGPRLWIIPASAIDGRDDITLHTKDTDCPFAGCRKR